jgi:hypothetical protein
MLKLEHGKIATLENFIVLSYSIGSEILKYFDLTGRALVEEGCR